MEQKKEERRKEKEKRKQLTKEFHSDRLFLLKLSRAKVSEDIDLLEKASDHELQTLCKVVSNIVEGHIPVPKKQFHQIPEHIVQFMDDNFDEWKASQSRKKCLEVLTPLQGQFQILLFHLFHTARTEDVVRDQDG